MRPATPILLVLLVLSLACSGGSSDGGVIGGVIATFVPDTPNPTDETTSMAQQSANGDTVVVQINVTGTEEVYSATIDVTFDPDTVEYLGRTPGNLFETLTGQAPIYLATPQPGRVVLGITSTDGEVDVAGTLTLIRLQFRVTEPGSFALGFDNMGLVTLDGNVEQDIPGITWSGGMLEGS